MVNNNTAVVCEWIDPKDEGPLYSYGCTAEPLAGKCYCAEHYSRVYAQGTALRKRKKDIRTANAVWDLESVMNEVIAELESEGVL